MDERRLLFAVALSLLVLTAYSLLFPPAPQPPAAPATSEPATRQPAAAAPAEAVPARAESASAAPAATAARPSVADERERRVEVTGADFNVAFSNKGARLVSWTLARYKDARGTPEEMVPAAGGGVRPLDIETGDPEVDERLKQALFRASSEAVQVAPGKSASLAFEYSDDELEAEKGLEFQASGLVTLHVRVRRRGR